MTKTRQKKYWYKYTHYECVLCSRGDTLKERVYSPRPREYLKRHSHVQELCGNHY